jgi:very-short-patch-repair endonuclease
MSTAPQPSPADGPICADIARFSAHRPSLDVAIGELAARQHGVVSLEQLVALGLSARGVQERALNGRLWRVNQAVYAVGHKSLTWEAGLMAAVLACGSGAVISHRSAVELWKLREVRQGPIDVTAPNRRGRVPSGIRSHRDDHLTAAERSAAFGIPCVSVPRALLDFAAVAPIWELRRAISEAEVLGILDHTEVRKTIRRHRGRRGVARLRMVLDEIRPETRRTRSEMEREFLRLCERAGLPTPKVNVAVRVGGRTQEPDFLWSDAGLIVEADSRAFHDTDSAFQLDRRREQRFQVAGWDVAHCTWEQIFQEPAALAQTIRSLLQQAEQRRRRADFR